MKRTLLLCFSIILLAGARAQIPPSVADRFQTILDSVGNKYEVKGMSAAVLIPGRGVWTGVHGVSHQGVPLDKDMLFCMGSNTKTYIAVLLLRLQEQGLLDLDDSIGKWLSGYDNLNLNATLRQSLNHTSGNTDYFAANSINDSILGKPGKIWTSEEIIRFAPEPEFEPGKKWSYSNTNYIILGLIIEKVLNKPWYQALEELILDPYNFEHTYMYGHQPSSYVLAHPWSMNITGTNLTDLTTTQYTDQLFSLAQAAGGLMVTAEANVIFWHRLQQGLVLHNSSWLEMTKTVNAGSGLRYGLGIMSYRSSNSRMVWSHGGTFFGYLHGNAVDTITGNCVSVLSNQDSFNNGGLDMVVDLLHKEILNTPMLDVKERTQLDITAYPNPVSDYLFLHRENESGLLEVRVFNGMGQELITSRLEEGENRIDVSTLSPGIYFLKVWGDEGFYQQRIAVE